MAKALSNTISMLQDYKTNDLILLENLIDKAIYTVNKSTNIEI